MIKENDSAPDSDWGIVTTNNFKAAEDDKQRAWIIDNFYENPDQVRTYALGQMYWGEGHGGVGWRTRKQFIFDGVKEKIESVMGKKITHWAETYSICGVFQSGFGDTFGIPPRVYHADSQKWAAMVFLTPDAPVEMGTKFVRNKTNKMYDMEGLKIPIEEVVGNGKTFCDSTRFEDVDTFGNVYNRMVIFDGHCVHSSMGYFGDSIANGRLWQMFFFDTDESDPYK